MNEEFNRLHQKDKINQSNLMSFSYLYFVIQRTMSDEFRKDQIIINI